MKKAADILGISYNILYGKYREVHGPLKKNDISQPDPLESCNVIKYHDYTGTALAFWKERKVKSILKVNQHRNILFDNV